MLLEEFEIFEPAIESEHVPGAFDDEIDQHAGIDEMKVDDQIVACSR